MEDNKIVNQRLQKSIQLVINFGYQLEKDSFSILKQLAQNQEIEQIIKETICF